MVGLPFPGGCKQQLVTGSSLHLIFGRVRVALRSTCAANVLRSPSVSHVLYQVPRNQILFDLGFYGVLRNYMT